MIMSKDEKGMEGSYIKCPLFVRFLNQFYRYRNRNFILTESEVEKLSNLPWGQSYTSPFSLIPKSMLFQACLTNSLKLAPLKTVYQDACFSVVFSSSHNFPCRIRQSLTLLRVLLLLWYKEIELRNQMILWLKKINETSPNRFNLTH